MGGLFIRQLRQLSVAFLNKSCLYLLIQLCKQAGKKFCNIYLPLSPKFIICAAFINFLGFSKYMILYSLIIWLGKVHQIHQFFSTKYNIVLNLPFSFLQGRFALLDISHFLLRNYDKGTLLNNNIMSYRFLLHDS